MSSKTDKGLQDRLGGTSGSLGRIVAAATELESALIDQSERARRLDAECGQAKNAQNTLSAQVYEKSLELQRLEEILRTRSAEWNRHLSELTQQNDKLRRDLQASHALAAELEQRSRAREAARIQEVEVRIREEATQAVRAELEAKRATERGEHATLLNAARESESAIQKLRSELEAANRRYNRLKVDSQSEVDLYRFECRELQQRLSAQPQLQQTERSKAAARIAELTEALEKARSESEARISELRREHERARSEDQMRVTFSDRKLMEAGTKARRQAEETERLRQLSESLVATLKQEQDRQAETRAELCHTIASLENELRAATLDARAAQGEVQRTAAQRETRTLKAKPLTAEPPALAEALEKLSDSRLALAREKESAAADLKSVEYTDFNSISADIVAANPPLFKRGVPRTPAN